MKNPHTHTTYKLNLVTIKGFTFHEKPLYMVRSGRQVYVIQIRSFYIKLQLWIDFHQKSIKDSCVRFYFSRGFSYGNWDPKINLRNPNSLQLVSLSNYGLRIDFCQGALKIANFFFIGRKNGPNQPIFNGVHHWATSEHRISLKHLKHSALQLELKNTWANCRQTKRQRDIQIERQA